MKALNYLGQCFSCLTTFPCFWPTVWLIQPCLCTLCRKLALYKEHSFQVMAPVQENYQGASHWGHVSDHEVKWPRETALQGVMENTAVRASGATRHSTKHVCDLDHMMCRHRGQTIELSTTKVIILLLEKKHVHSSLIFLYIL